jgi:hypothetical protein
MDIRVRTEPLGAENESKFLVLAVSGTLPIGSLSNAEIAYWTNWCRNYLGNPQASDSRLVAVVFDMTCLHYRFRDAIGSLWIPFLCMQDTPLHRGYGGHEDVSGVTDRTFGTCRYKYMF